MTQVKIDGVVFPTIRGAAKFIVDAEDALGITRKLETVRVELKRIAIGKCPSRMMYSRYLCEAV